ARGAAREVRVSDQSEDREDPGAYDPPDCPLSGGRGAPMTARTLIVALTLSLLMAPYAVEAQQPAKVSRIGILAGSAQAPRERRGYDAWQQGLRELGYVEGQN